MDAKQACDQQQPRGGAAAVAWGRTGAFAVSAHPAKALEHGADVLHSGGGGDVVHKELQRVFMREKGRKRKRRS